MEAVRVMPDRNLSVMEARADEKSMNRFIQENKRFIMASAYHAVNHFVTESDDEWSIALIAFHEAVRTYDESRGDFRAFASLVIRRRLLDYLRSEGKHSAEISVEPASMEGDLDETEDVTALQMEIRRRNAEASALSGNALSGNVTVRDEIEAVQSILQGYGFSFFDLTECSPRAEKTKKGCAEAVAAILKDDSLFIKMRSSKTLPVKEICAASGISRKILERHRKYIIAAAEILNGEYPLLAEYMNYIRKALDP